MDIFEISGYVAIGLILTAVLIPGIAVPAIFCTPIALCIWMAGQCLPVEDAHKETTQKK